VRKRNPSDGFAFQVLNVFTARAYSALTASVYRPLLERPALPFTATGASINGEAVGLALATHADQTAHVLSIYVRPEYRRQRVGLRLLELLEANVTRHSARAELTYALGKDALPFEHFLQACGWPLEGPRLYVFSVSARIASAPWFARATLPDIYTIEDWGTITQKERETLMASQESEGWIPEHLVPFGFELRLERLNSLILRRAGTVIGWLLTETYGDGHIRYINLYVRPSLNRVGHTFCTLALIAEAARRHIQSYGAQSRGFFEVQPANTDFLRFIDRHLGSHVVARTELKKLTKKLR
jgi:GNAT superfamily N-acetyltransferase